MLLRKIFIHIPKNAGMTVRRSPLLVNKIMPAVPEIHKNSEYTEAVKAKMDSIGDHHGYEHARWKDLKWGIRSAHDSFAIVRNPWDRVVSRYFFAKKVIEVEKKEPVGKHPIESFEAFLEDRHKWGGVKYMWHRAIRGWYNQVDYVVDKDKNIQPDILKFEDLNNELCNYFSLQSMSQARNVTGLNDDYKSIYTPKTIQIVADWYKKDIDTFGFDFDTGATKNLWSMK